MRWGGGLIDSIYRDYHAAGVLIDSIYRDYHGGGALIDSIYRGYHAAWGANTVSTGITMLPGGGGGVAH